MVIHFKKAEVTNEEEDDMLDIAIPETYVTVVRDGKLHTTALESLE